FGPRLWGRPGFLRESRPVLAEEAGRFVHHPAGCVEQVALVDCRAGLRVPLAGPLRIAPPLLGEGQDEPQEGPALLPRAFDAPPGARDGGVPGAGGVPGHSQPFPVVLLLRVQLDGSSGPLQVPPRVAEPTSDGLDVVAAYRREMLPVRGRLGEIGHEV